ncbi:NAD-dependent epimerase/dehydratase family protein [Cryobacterium sp. TMT1-19]|uniref:NAD-dependent epimerase/dehydratase family protein n=1 Tax=Cryobacterium sp. TMT1-19 TaxID=1259231 RepID=UPI00106D0104|nr:NAD-dependent epimerase/dehydratase family protein [Cryobacterium sp. TMT1-19]
MKVLVTGANGFVGKHLCEHLVGEGHEVTAAVRRLDIAPPGTRAVIVGDLGPETDWSEAVRGQNVVVHLAARVHVMDEKDSDPMRAFTLANTEGTRKLAQDSVAASVSRIVYVSSIKANGESTTTGSLVASDTPTPIDPYGMSKLNAETALRKIELDSSLDVIVIRPPLIYGDGVGGNLLRLMWAIERGIPLPLGSVLNSRSMIFVENLVVILGLCVLTQRNIGDPLLVADDESLSTADVVRELSAGMGRHPRLFPVPVAWLALTGSLLGKRADVSRLTGSLQVSSNIHVLDASYKEQCSSRAALRLTARAFSLRATATQTERGR